ncbi:phenylalanine--tRNA ligase subunit beta [Candidatus Pacearchaeota archaeon]|nr:phenylalanine--tRNA ligase subunit beta [Candidatus Pacearchaeota archaeon]
MTNIIFSRKEFEKHIKITPEIQERITLFGTPLENVSQENVEIEVLSNRPDLISLEGFMRSFKKFLGKEPGLKKYDIKKPEKNYRVYVDKLVKEIRPYVSCAIIKNISLNEEKLKDIINLQEKLALTLGRNRKKIAIGIYPLDKITFPLYYTSKEPKDIKYTPLGADRELTADEILMLHPTGRKYEHLLKNQRRYPIFIDSDKKIISMPPIINSELTGRVDTKTKDLFIECTGTDKNVIEKTLIIIATSLAELEGNIYQVEIIDKEKYNTPILTNQKIKISLQNVNKLLGLNLTENQISQLLAKMGHNYKNGVAEIAPWRIDILHEVDLIEDIAIAYGYNNFSPEIPNISTSGQESKESIIKRKISEILIGLELLEISTYHLIKPEEVENYNTKDALELLDSKSEYKYLRPNLLIPILRISSENKDAEYPQKLFEIGRVFNKNVQKENGIEENDNLILSISPANATEIKKHLDYLFKMLDLEYSIKEITKPHLIDGRTCAILLNNRPIGYFGEVHPNTLRKQGIQMPIALAEISLEEVYKLIN